MLTAFGLTCSLAITVCFAAAGGPAATMELQVVDERGVERLLGGVSRFMDQFIGSMSAFANDVWRQNNVTRRADNSNPTRAASMVQPSRATLSEYYDRMLGVLADYHPKDLRIMLRKLRAVLEQYGRNDTGAAEEQPGHRSAVRLRACLLRVSGGWQTPALCRAALAAERAGNSTAVKTFLRALEPYYTDDYDNQQLQSFLEELSHRPTRSTLQSFIQRLVIDKYNSLNDSAKYEFNSAATELTETFFQATTVYIRLSVGRRYAGGGGGSAAVPGGSTAVPGPREARRIRDSLEKALRAAAADAHTDSRDVS